VRDKAGTPAEAPPPVIDSRASAQAALQWGFDAAMAEGARRIVCVDRDWAAWPVLDNAALHQALGAWLRRPQRRLVLLGRGFETLSVRCPRLERWRADWMHAIEAWQLPEDRAGAEPPTLLLSDGAVSVHLIDAETGRGRAERDPRRARQWCEEIDAAIQRSERTWAVRPLGL
jgi:hypothetical protein